MDLDSVSIPSSDRPLTKIIEIPTIKKYVVYSYNS